MEAEPLLPSTTKPDKHLKIKTILTYIIIAVFFFCGGVEFSVILPTCWDFMRLRFHSEKWLYGLTLAAMSMSNLVIGPIMGGIYDRTHRTKTLITILLVFQVGGNFMYFAATSKYMVLGSRFIVGVGMGSGAVLFGELARVTSKKKRTSVFSLFMSTRQIGLVIGPACNLFLRECNFYMGPFSVDKYTSPALFMTFIYTILGVFFIFLFFHLPTVMDEDDEEDGSVSDHQISPTHKEVLLRSQKAKGISDTGSISPTHSVDDKAVLVTSGASDYGSINTRSSRSPSITSINSVFGNVRSSFVNTTHLSRQLFREETVLLLAMMNFAMLAQLINETGCVPFAEAMFGWHELQTSIVFSAAGIELIISFILAGILSKFFADRWLILFGLVIELLGFVWLLGTFGRAKHFDWGIEAFIFGIFLILLGLPIFIVAAAALYSKMLDPRIQGFGQGVRRSMLSTASILGPLWAGAAFELEDSYGYYPYYGVSVFLVAFLLVLLPFSFSKLKEPQRAKRLTNIN